MRSLYLRLMLASVLLWLPSLGWSAAPNVLFLLADDQRADTIHAWGNPSVETPNLDRLAAEGASFRNTYIMGARNAAVCMPSRAMLMTGRPLLDFDEIAGVVPQEFPMLPELLRGSGYRTFITGKWHQDTASLNRAFETGERIFLGGMHDPFKIPLQPYDQEGRYPRDHAVVESGRHATELFADSAISFLRSQTGEHPFFAYVAFTQPHDPRVTLPEYHEKYTAQLPELPDNFLPEHPFDNGELKIRDELLAAHPRTEPEVRKHLADYYACVSHLDAQVGRILQALDESGLASNTIIVYAADNGLALGSHGLLGKQNLYEHSVRVPLLMAGPGIPRNFMSEALVLLNDLHPTLLELCGSTPPLHPFAQSIAPLLRGERASHREHIRYQYKQFQIGVRRGDWKLIRYEVGGVTHEQLFNLSTDPSELKNLLEDPFCAGTLAEMRTLLDKDT